MKRISIALGMMIAIPILGAARSAAQSMDDLNLQVHGYATQGFIYSTNNNWNTTASTDGSAAWTEAVVNLTAQPQPRLRIGMQARYYLLGDYGNQITLDWAEADYKVNEKFGFRAGKVKTPAGLLNETQDIDPVQLWVELPQSIYPISSRTALLAHFGGVLYGAIPLGEAGGKLGYSVYAGERVIGSDDGYFQTFKDAGLTVPNPLTVPVLGGTVDWRTPFRGLEVGASESAEHTSGTVLYGQLPGTFDSPRFTVPDFFARYDRGKVMVGGEYSRLALHSTIDFPGLFQSTNLIDERAFYAMASYRFADKFTGGVYYSSSINQQAAFTSARYQKDWALAGRYDFNPYLYLKAEQHFVDGTELGYSTSDNSVGLQPNSRMTLIKLGVSF